jgi:hypothetical protein
MPYYKGFVKIVHVLGFSHVAICVAGNIVKNAA